MEELKLKLPAYFLELTGINPEDASIVILRELAVHYFQQGILTFGQARRLTNLSKWEFMTLLKDRKIPLHYGLTEFKDDLIIIEKLAKSAISP
jgi:predicted HTH domain antitoxin